MSGRRDRMARVAKAASESEERARAHWAEAKSDVDGVDRQREAALTGAAALATQDVPIRLRGHLTDTGARFLTSLADRKSELQIEAEQRRVVLQEAATAVKSLERLIDRLDAEADERQRRSEAADLADLVAVRAARANQGQPIQIDGAELGGVR